MAQAINNFTITGNLAQDPEVKTTSNGKKYAFITIAVNGANKEKADFISFVIWERLSEIVCEYCKKGDCISALGHISTMSKEGKTTIQLTADSISFLHKAAKKAPEQPKKDEAFDPSNDTFQKADSGDIFAPF